MGMEKTKTELQLACCLPNQPLDTFEMKLKQTNCARGNTIYPRPSPPSRAAEQTQRSSTFPRRIRSNADRCSRVKAVQSNKLPGDLDLWPFDFESGVRVTCDVGYLCANFGLPRPLCYRVRPDVCDRQTSDKSIA